MTDMENIRLSPTRRERDEAPQKNSAPRDRDLGRDREIVRGQNSSAPTFVRGPTPNPLMGWWKLTNAPKTTGIREGAGNHVMIAGPVVCLV